MDTHSASRLILLGRILNNVNAYDLADTVKKLQTKTRALHKIAENECNGWPKLASEFRSGKLYQYHTQDEDWRKRDEKKEVKLKHEVNELLKGLKAPFKVEFQGDPRGAVVKINIDGQDYTDLIYLV